MTHSSATAPVDTKMSAALMKKTDQAITRLTTARDNVGTVIFGQARVVDLAITAVLSGGHALLVGVPGLAKTRLVETLGTVLGLDTGRIQFTPDLMPSDIVGSEVLEQTASGKRSFRFIKGPVFCQLLMADEINRASPRTQSALLQAMQERHITVAGARHDLPAPFHVLATQNPIEQEGTYPLPEAQLDRFLFQIDIDFPDRATEREVLLATTMGSEAVAKRALTAKQLQDAQSLVRELPIGDHVVDAILTLVRNARPGESDIALVNKSVSWGPGPRAGQALMLATRAKALLDGRIAPSIDDVLDLAGPVLGHRMALNFAARADGQTLAGIIETLKARLQ